MTLESYSNGRVVALHADTTVYDALRAMEDNHVGAVVVREGGVLVGIVTDCDLAREVIKFDEDPFVLQLGSVMSGPVHTIPVSSTPLDAARVMLERCVRRLPIVSGAALVGIVTLDDLIVDQAAPADLLSAIVRAQLAQPTRLKQAGQRRPPAPFSAGLR
jgi:CBS domain-containing protein